MVNLRCTKKLLEKLHITKIKEGTISSNILGDWYADYFNIGRNQFIIFTNEITTLSVIIPAKKLSSIIPRFIQSLEILLKSIGLDKEKIEIELKELSSINYARTKNRSLSGNMNNLIKGARMWLLTEPDGDLSHLNMYLSNFLIGPAPYHKPGEKVRDLFHNKTEINFFQVDRQFEK
ncbi:MAG: hypothetical protein V1874_09230 [Spirochaetota bacterium]